MVIEQKDLEFLLSHFEPPALPRRISTFTTDAKYRDKQYPVFTVEYMLKRFREADELDCKVNAYRYLGQKYHNEDSAGGNGNDNGNGNGNGHGKHHHNTNNFYNYEYNNYELTRDAVAKLIQQRAEAEAAPTLLDIDLDIKDFSSKRKHKNAVKRTIAKIHDTFLIPEDKSPVSTIWSGGGTHILLPFEMDPAKYPVANRMTTKQMIPGRDLRYASLFTGSHDYRFNTSHRLPSNLFLWFAEDFLTDGLRDAGHKPSVRSAMIRVPGSYNSKYIDAETSDKSKAEVHFEQRWDGHTKAHILFLLGSFYRDINDSLKKQARKQARARKVRFQAQAAQMALDRTLNTMPVAGHIAAHTFGEGPYSEYAHTKYWYIDKLLQTPLEDYRKRSIDLLLTPFLITVKGMPDAVAMRLIMNWLERCNTLRPLDFDAEARVSSKILDVRTMLQLSAVGFQPLSEDRLKAEHADWFHKLTGSAGKEVVGGGN